MPEQQIVDIIRTQLLPRLQNNSFQLQPSPLAATMRSEHYLPIYPHPLHSHPFFEWIWCVENHAFLKIGDRVHRLEAGDFCLLPPGEMHADVYIPSQNSYQVLWCKYKEEAIHAHHYLYTPVNRLKHMAGIFATAPSFTAPLLGALQHELKTEQAYREPVCYSLVSSLAHLMLRAFEASLRCGEQKRFPGKISFKVDEYLNQHFSEPLALADVARALHISRNYLATLYKRETAKTIGQTLTQIRLEHAKKLLLETELSVQTVAKAAGYETPEHFSRVFRRQEGMTPGRYGK